MNIPLKVLLILWLLSPAPLFSCGNEYESYPYTRADGSISFPEESPYQYHFRQGFDREALTEQRKKLEAKLSQKKDYRLQSDHALVLLKLGEFKEGLKILQRLIMKYPEEYNVAANLGTAYELNGNTDSALKYIRRGLEINPGSHEGSEWIHVRILEARQKMQQDPHYLKRHSILGLKISPGNAYTPEEISGFRKTKEELAWQLTERIHFVKPEDPVVADLLFTLADLIAVTEYVESSLNIYDLSLTYDLSMAARILDRRQEIKRITYWARIRSYFPYVLCTLALFAGLILLIRRWRQRRRHQKNVSDVPVFTSATIKNEL